MTRDAIISRVRSKIDEISAPDDLSLVDDVFAVIDKNLDDSANSLLLKAPLWLTRSHEIPIPGNHEHIGKTGGKIRLPSNFLRLHSFQMQDWQTPVFNAIGEDHPFYQYRFNKVLTAPHRPVVAIADSPDGVFLEYYGTKGDRSVKKALYVRRVSGDNIEHLPGKILDGLFWQAAMDFFIIVQQPENAKGAELKLQEFLALNNKSHTHVPQTD